MADVVIEEPVEEETTTTAAPAETKGTGSGLSDANTAGDIDQLMLIIYILAASLIAAIILLLCCYLKSKKRNRKGMEVVKDMDTTKDTESLRMTGEKQAIQVDDETVHIEMIPKDGGNSMTVPGVNRTLTRTESTEELFDDDVNPTIGGMIQTTGGQTPLVCDNTANNSSSDDGGGNEMYELAKKKTKQ